MKAGIAINPADFVPEPAPAAGIEIDPHEFTPEEQTQDASAAPGGVESALRGVKQGVTLGFGDELAGALGWALAGGEDGSYTKARDEARAADKAAKEAHPYLYGGGELAGGLATSLVPGLNVAKGATLAATAGRAALAGAVAGLGGSEAELAGPERDVGGALTDTAIGGALGGALGYAGGKLGRVASGAEERVDRRLLSAVGDQAKKSTRDKLATNAENVKEVLAEQGITKKVAENASELAERIGAVRESTGKAIGEKWAALDENSLGVRPKDIVSALRSVQKQYADTPATKGQADYIRGLVTDTVKQFGGEKRVPLSKVNKFVTGLENSGFSGAADPTVRKELQRKAAAAVEGVLQKRLAEIQESAKNIAETGFASRPGFEGAGAAASAAEAIPALNKTYRVAKDVGAAAAQRARLEPFSETGLRSFTLRGLAEKLWDGTAGKLTDPADQALARIVKAAKAGSPKAVKMLQAMYGGGQQATAATAPSVPGLALHGLSDALAGGEDENDYSFASR